MMKLINLISLLAFASLFALTPLYATSHDAQAKEAETTATDTASDSDNKEKAEGEEEEEPDCD